MQVQVNYEITAQQICDTLVSAFEGGSNYWALYSTLEYSAYKPKPGLVWYGQEKVFEAGFTFELSWYDPDAPDAVKHKMITENDVERGLQMMADKYPEHFANIMQETGDAVTGDVLLQCIAFGEVIYG